MGRPDGYAEPCAPLVESGVAETAVAAQLLDRQGAIKAQQTKTEEKQGEETVDEEAVETNVSPGKTQE